MRYEIDLSGVASREELHARIRRALPPCEYYGNNLDALNDALTALAGETEIVFRGAEQMAPEFAPYLEKLKRFAAGIGAEAENVKIAFLAAMPDRAGGEADGKQERKERGPMQFRDLKAQYRALKDEMDQAILNVAANCNFIMGQDVKDLEKELAEYTGSGHCVTCANGTDALSIAMMVWGIGPGDAVFVPDFTFFSSAEIAAHAGATPIFCDVKEETFNLDPASLDEAVQRVLAEGKLKPRVCVAVDLFGLPADLLEIRKICDRYGLLLLEDAAQGFGGRIGDRIAGTFGIISTTSFFPAKPLGCYGDGGALFMDDAELANLADSIRVHGKGRMKYDNVRIGLNSRLDTMQAAVLRVKLKAFKAYELEAVNQVAALYDQAFAERFGQDGALLKTPVVPAGFYSSWAQYTLRLTRPETRAALQAFLKERGIPSMIYYPKTMQNQEAFAGIKALQKPCPVAEKLTQCVLSVPMHPYLSAEDVREVVDAIASFYGI